MSSKSDYYSTGNPNKIELEFQGEFDMLRHLVDEGYDHIVDIHEDETIAEIARSRGHDELGVFLEGIPEFEVCDSRSNYLY